ncbi:KRAB-A domain-containing protein 2-like [Diprion similis]|uniref:KRAB-A domain-containing protein 2-like n=1 Tax=Diprion similis TaxID=362088 RepID=UPI001EF81AE8|nr:KRAB-A domain-containing protein 2-like [Diprion similis]
MLTLKQGTVAFTRLCQRKKSFPKKGVVVKPLLLKEVSARAQVDLIDMQSCKDQDYKFILNYQEHLTKFVLLRPLKTKTAAKVAYVLIDLFCVFGAPAVLQPDNGSEFVNSIINELSLLWPGLKIVHGKPRHSQELGKRREIKSRCGRYAAGVDD